jgi:cytochrome P450
LSPNGAKRHPLAFSPFLGGKRICLGKTFAENLGKVFVGLIFSQLDFTFVDSTDAERKLTNAIFSDEPMTKVKINLI